ncbi:MAG: thiamine pyrophosphate-binding protein [Desulfobacterales bacterium]
MSQMTGGEAVYRTLLRLGVRHVFGIPSVHNIPIFDALLQGGQIDTVIVRNEQAGTHAADGYYRATGEMGVIIASTGPGTTNTITGLYEADFASSKVLLITGQSDSIFYGKGKGQGHEAENQIAMLQTVVDSVASPRSTQAISPAIVRVVAQMNTGRHGPGAVEIPIDLQYQTAEIEIPEIPDVRPIAPQADAINAAAALLSDSKRPVIVAGGGVIASGASAALVEWAESTNTPVFTTVHGRGSISDEHPLCMGAFLGNPAFHNAMTGVDTILAIGTWFQAGGQMPLPGKLIHVDVDPRKIGLVYPADVSVIGDALLAINGIRSAMNAGPGDTAFIEEMQSARDQARQGMRKIIGPDHEGIMDAIRTVAPDDAIMVRDMTIPAYMWGNQLLPIYAPHTTMHPVSGAIGAGLPLAIGAATATAKKTVIIQGDGGFMVHIGELSTAVQYQLPIVVCVFTDGGYGVLRGIQHYRFQGRTIGVDLATPNFVTVARGMGMNAEGVSSLEEFKDAYSRAIQADGPYLIDINTSSIVPITGLGRAIEFTQPQE